MNGTASILSTDHYTPKSWDIPKSRHDITGSHRSTLPQHIDVSIQSPSIQLWRDIYRFLFSFNTQVLGMALNLAIVDQFGRLSMI
jgi:hypothetical protein